MNCPRAIGHDQIIYLVGFIFGISLSLLDGLGGLHGLVLGSWPRWWVRVPLGLVPRVNVGRWPLRVGHGTVASGCIFLLDNDDLLLTPDLSTPDDGAAGQKDKKDEETPDKPKP